MGEKTINISEEEYLVNWPELSRTFVEKRCELVIVNQNLDQRTPSVNSEALQSCLFRKVSIIFIVIIIIITLLLLLLLSLLLLLLLVVVVLLLLLLLFS